MEPEIRAIASPPKTASGTMIAVPNAIAKVVSKIGRNRIAPASQTASIRS